jgi:hypothetical protein
MKPQNKLEAARNLVRIYRDVLELAGTTRTV